MCYTTFVDVSVVQNLEEFRRRCSSFLQTERSFDRELLIETSVSEIFEEAVFPVKLVPRERTLCPCTARLRTHAPNCGRVPMIVW